MYDPKRIARLIVLRHQGEASIQEEIELDKWIASSPGNKKFVEIDMHPQRVLERTMHLLSVDFESIREKLLQKIRCERQ